MSWEPSTWADLETILSPSRDLQEREYRRGYRDGFIAATEALYELWFLKGKQQVYDALWDFWTNDLLKWQRSEPLNSLNNPPRCFIPCIYCGNQASHLDHYMPKALGGTNSRENLVPTCEQCNLEKSDMHPDDWERILRERNGR